LKKQYSLKGRCCFSAVFDGGRLFKSRTITFTVLQECPLTCHKKTAAASGCPKFGIVVSKRYGKAHDRNKARRRFRAAIAPYTGTFEQSFCVVVRFTNQYKDAAFVDIQNDVLYLLRKSSLLQ